MRLTMALACVGFIFVNTNFVGTVYAQLKIGAIGDSLVDEHFDQGFPSSKNALELMVTTGRVDAGPLGAWGGTRRNGYKFNWALAGATTGSLIADGQHTNLAAQINDPANGITKAIMVVGANDLFPAAPTGGPGSNYEAIYTGVATPAQINLVASQAVANVVTAAQVLKNTGVDLIVATAPDYGIAPFTTGNYPIATQRELVDNVIEAWNAQAVALLTDTVQVPVVDLYRLTKDIWGDHGSENATFQLGGVDLDLSGTSVSPDSTAAFVADGIHPNNAIGGIFANLFMTGFNQEYGDSFALFSEQEILANAGPSLVYTGNTFEASLGGKTYSDYVIAAVPEPNSLIVLGSALLFGLTTRRRSAA